MGELMREFIYKDELERKIYQKVINHINKKYFKNYGKNVEFGRPLLLKNPQYISVGNNVAIRSGIRLEPIKQYKGRKLNPQLVIADNVRIEQNCHIICTRKVHIQEGVLISSNVFISDCSHIYKDINRSVQSQGLDIKETIIGSGSFIGAGAKILAGVTVGKHCVIGANCVVNKDIPDYSIVVGVPGRVIKRYDSENNEWKKV